MEHRQFALWKILIRIRILVIGIVQTDEIDIIIILIGHCDCPDRKKLASAAETSKRLILLFVITGEVMTVISVMILTTTSNACAVQLAHNHVFGGC